MTRIIVLLSFLTMLTACQDKLITLTSIDDFPEFILDDMDKSVVEHLEVLKSAIKLPDSNETQQFMAWKNLANALHAYQLYQPAEMAYKNALLFEVDEDVVSYQLAHMYRLQSEYDKSNQLFYKLAEKINDYPPIYNNLAENLFDQGLIEEAKSSILKSLDIKKDEAYALKIYADLLIQSGEADHAIKVLQQALNQQPSATKMYFTLAQAHQQTGNQEAADLARAQGGNGTIATVDLWLSQVTESMQGYNQFIAKAETYLNRKDYQNAMIWAKKAESDRPKGFTIQMVMGVLNVRLGQLDDALKRFRDAYRLRPHDFKVNLNLGTVYKQQGEYHRALGYFRKAMELDPNHQVAEISYADAACLANKMDEAMTVFNDLKIGDLKQQAMFLGLKCLTHHKEYLQAHQWIEDHIGLTVNNKSFVEYAVLLHVASPIDEKRNGQMALNWLKQMMGQRASNKQKQLLVMGLMEIGQFEQAQQIMGSIQQEPNLFLHQNQLQQLLSAKTPFRMQR